MEHLVSVLAGLGLLDLVVEGAQAYPKSLEYAEGIRDVHIKSLLAVATKLKIDFAIIEIVRQLEVLLARLSYAPVIVLPIVIALRQEMHYLWLSTRAE